tara:strand:+ start:460 stop:582 length:123 start_codon:yes stop_codon:yes gene_type:complete
VAIPRPKRVFASIKEANRQAIKAELKTEQFNLLDNLKKQV